ncbi:MAG TPA: BREX system P-loop protein BrxC, partial [Methanomethylovorans sp.]|nr:BREX system P-loop protein BrxC [Methanomethylovorans sp.]
MTRDFESDSEILKVLQADDLEKFGFGRSDTNKLALKEVLDHLNIKPQRNDSVVLQDLKDKFRRKPYGWKELTVSGLVATLFASDEIKLRYQKTYLVLKKPNAEEVVRYLTRKDYADKLVVEIREKPPDAVMKTVRSIMREVFDKTNIPEKENDLLEFTHSLLNDEFIKIEQISGKYEEEKRFPGKDEVKAYAGFLKQILNTTDPSAFLQKISDEKEELVKLRYEVEPVISFFGGQQVEIFRRLLKKIDNYTRDRQFMDDETKSKVRDVEAILGSKEPYSEIKSLPPLEASIENALSAALEKLKEEAFKEIESIIADLQKEMDQHKALTSEFKDSVLKPLTDHKLRISQAEDCTYVQAQ